MVLCDTCDEWFHLNCVGLTEQSACEEANWKCGYCRSERNNEGKRVWSLELPDGTSKKLKVAKPRHDDDTAKARGESPSRVAQVGVGPSSWGEIVSGCQQSGMRRNLEEKRKKVKAAKLLKKGGHHIVDEVTVAGLAQRPVDSALVDDLECLGLLDDVEEEDD
jgi:hypothetical protein